VAPPPGTVHEVQAYEAPPPAAPMREEPRVAAPRAELPRIDAKQILDDSGLVMIETDRNKVQIQPPLVEEPPALGRPRRERQKPVPQDEELVQVETTRK